MQQTRMTTVVSSSVSKTLILRSPRSKGSQARSLSLSKTKTEKKKKKKKEKFPIPFVAARFPVRGESKQEAMPAPAMKIVFGLLTLVTVGMIVGNVIKISRITLDYQNPDLAPQFDLKFLSLFFISLF